MVDEARVLRLLRSIANDTAVLRQEAGASEERRQDPIWLRGVKYTFVTAIEVCRSRLRRSADLKACLVVSIQVCGGRLLM